MSTYSRILEGLLIPAYYRLRGRKYAAYCDFLERSQWWSRDQVNEFQWREVRALLGHAFRTVPYYRKKYAAVGAEYGDVKTREDFAKLPPLTRTEVNEHRTELCSTDPQSRLLPKATGGSSGLPARFFITLDSYDWRSAATARAYSWNGCRSGERTLYLWGAPVGRVPPLENAKVHAHRFLRREVVVATFSQTLALWQQTLERVRRFRPKYLAGYVTSLENFGRYLLAEKKSIPGLQAVIAAAEPLHEDTRELLQEVFECPVFNTYGAREFMSIAAECEHHAGLHIHAENLLVETEGDAGQGPSEFLITDLHNCGMPFLRYRIGDTGSLIDSGCACGRGLPLLHVEGRAREVLRTRDGRVVSGIFFPHTLKDIPEVSEFEAQQASLDEIILSVVLSRPLSESSEALLRQEIAKVFGTETRVTVRPVESIPRLPSGKRRTTVGIE
jgi:phenylacetate-CoA ligase